MTTFSAVLDNSKTNVEGHSKFLNRLFAGGTSNDFLSTSLKVVQRGAGANMSADVSVGDAHLELPSTSYSFWSWIDAAANVVITAADPTNPRIDAIVGWVDTSVTTTASNNSPGSFKFSAIAGTPAGSPTIPSNATIQAALGASVAWVRLANVTVGAAVSSIVTANIADARTSIASRLAIGASAISATTMFTTALNPVTRDNARFFDHISSGCVWSGLSYGTTLTATCTAGVVFLSGKYLTVATVTTRTFTASVDTYCDLQDNGDGTAIWVYQTTTNNAVGGSAALTAGNLRGAIIITGASNIAAATSVNQGQETMVLPITSSNPYAVTDSLGNLICPRDPNRKLLGYRPIITTFSTNSTTAVQVTGLSVPVIIPTGRKVKVRTFIPQVFGDNGSSTAWQIILWDGTVVSGTQLQNSFVNRGTLTATTIPVLAEAMVTPTATSKTYNVSAQITVGNLSAVGGATAPAFVSVELE